MLNSKIMRETFVWDKVIVYNLCRFWNNFSATSKIQQDCYSNKYQKHIVCSYGYKLVCVEGKFSQPFKTYLGKDALYNFNNNMIAKSKYCSDVMKKHFNK